tara:strand:- start:268 stop:801 length:534 start_codon:yes stop_codon:yes gene_type:complete
MKTTNTKEKIKEHFFMNPTSKLRVRQIEKSLGLSLPSVIRYCKELKKEGILKTLEIRNVIFYTADRANNAYLLNKTFFNIRQIHKSEILIHIKEKLNNPPIILFGSYAKGEDIEESDIDIFIESPSKKELNLSKFEKLLQRKIQIFKYKSIKDIKNKNLANNIINGIMLNNYIEVFK